MRLLAATKGSPPAMAIRRATGSLVPMCQMKPTRRLTHWQTVNPLPKPTQPRRSKRPWPSGRTSTSACKPSSTTTASARSRRRWTWCRPGAATCCWRCCLCATTCSAPWTPCRRATIWRRCGKFTEALRRKGVTEIEVLDKEFDADFSEAVARFAAGDEKKGKVIDVVQTGYMLGEKVLRFAKVVVGE